MAWAKFAPAQNPVVSVISNNRQNILRLKASGQPASASSGGRPWRARAFRSRSCGSNSWQAPPFVDATGHPFADLSGQCRAADIRAFCACMRFSASSHTTDCGPSMTSASTSSPRWAAGSA